jgi:two-component system cell cycle response regulator
MHSLIIESNEANCRLLDNILGQQGFDSDICGNIGSARSYVDSEIYDIICINYQLQDGQGSDLVEFCNSHPRNSNTPILYLTDTHTSEAQKKSLRVDKIINMQNTQQIADQITHFIESRLDPVFSEGRILFIEDSKTVAAVILSQLKNTGYQVEHYRNAEDAWLEFENEVAYGSDSKAFDLVITDITLAGSMSGHELAEKIRALDDARGFIPIIAVTGDTSDELRLSLFKSGVNDFIQKPILSGELLVRIRNLITTKRLLDKVHDQRRELFALATTDMLTGCQNRHSLMEFSGKFFALSSRQKYPISMLVIDLDYFKSINDTQGHAIGDLVLGEVGKLLNQLFRESDLVARFGGEEFVVLMSHCDQPMAHTKAEKLRQAIEDLKPNGILISASIGFTSRQADQSGSFDELFSSADKGVYAAKNNGRNCVVYKPIEVQ